MNRAPPIVAIIPSTEPDERKPDEGGAGVGFIGSDLSTSVNEEILSALRGEINVGDLNTVTSLKLID